jgi:GDPmannose 4,6-dehydratase
MLNKVAIITGTGMDSKTLTHILLSKNYHVIMTYRRNTSQDLQEIFNLFSDDLIKYPDSSLNFDCLECLDQCSIIEVITKTLQKFGKIDEFYHLAAQSHVGESFKCETYSIQANSLPVYYILDTLKNNSIKTKFYFANTSECFGGDPKNCPFNEDSPAELRSPYSLGKNSGAKITDYFRQTYDMYACYGWLFNHSNFYRHDSFYCAKIAKGAAKIFLGKQQEITIGSVDHWRDEHFSDYGCEMMIKMLNNEKGPKNYVIGNGNCHHGLEYIENAFGYFNLDWKKYIKFDDKFKRTNEVLKLVADPTLAIKDLGWKPNRITFKEHIGLMCEYFYNKENGVIKRPNVFEMFP